MSWFFNTPHLPWWGWMLVGFVLWFVINLAFIPWWSAVWRWRSYDRRS